MAKLTGYSESVATPSPSLRGGGQLDPTTVSPQRAGDIGGGLQRLGTTVAEYALKQEDEKARIWAATNIAQARLDWSQQLVERQSDPNYNKDGADGFTPGILDDYDKYSSKMLDTAPNDASRKFLASRLIDLRADLGTKALVYEAKARIDWRKDQFVQAGNTTATTVAADPTQFKPALAEQLAIIDSSAMPQEQRSAIRQWMTDKVAVSAVWGQIQKDPGRFLQSIGFYGDNGDQTTGKLRKTSGDFTGITGNDAFDVLQYDAKVKMFGAAVSAKAQQDADRERLIRMRGSAAGDEAMKEVYARAFAPGGSTLTRDFVESVRPVLKPDEYHSALTMLRTGPGIQNDPATYANLERLIYSRDLDGAEKFAYAQHRNHNLTNETLGAALSRIDQFRKQDGPKSAYERGREYINRQLNPGQLVYDPVRNGRLADALRDYDNYQLANSKATDKDLQERSEEIVKSYALVNLHDKVISLPVPIGTNIRRVQDPVLLEQDIGQAGLKIQDDLRNKKITRSEYQLRMAQLKRWRDALDAAKGIQK